MATSTIVGRAVVLVQPKIPSGAAQAIGASLQAGIRADQIGRNIGQLIGSSATAAINSNMNGAQIGQQLGQQIGQQVGQQVGQQTTQNMNQQMQSGGSGIGSTLGKAMLTGIAALGLGGLIMNTIKDQLGKQETTGLIASKLGLTKEDAQAVAKNSMDVYAAGYGDTKEQVNNTMTSIMGTIKGAREATSADLAAMTKDSINFTKTFGFEASEVNRALGNMMDNGIIKDYEQGLNILTVGMQKNGEKADDLLDTFNEYSGDFAQFGLTGEEAISALTNLMDAGIYTSDKAADGIRESFVRIRSQDKPTIAALESMGLSAQDLSDQFIAGGDSAKAGFSQVIKSIQEAEGQVKSTAINSIFGSPGEDFYNGFSKISPDIFNNLGDLGTAVDQVENNYATTGRTIEAFKRTTLANLSSFVETDVLPNLMDFADWFKRDILPSMMPAIEGFKSFIVNLREFGPVIKGIVDWMVEWKDVLLPIVIFIGTFAGVIKTIAIAKAAWAAITATVTAAQIALNVAMTANPIGLIIAAVAGLVAVFIYFWKTSDGFRNFWIDLWPNIQNAIGAFGGWLTGTAGPAIQGFFTSIGEWFVGIGDNINGFFFSIGEALGGFLARSHERLMGVSNTIGAFFGSIFEKIGGLFRGGVDFVGEGISKIINFLAGMGAFIGNIFSNIGNFFKETFNTVVGTIRSSINLLISVINAPIKAINGIKVSVPGWVPKIGGKSWQPKIGTIPSFADGGVVKAQAGGSVIRVAERGQDERIIGEHEYQAQRSALAKLQRNTDTNSKNEINNNFTVNGYDKSPEELAAELFRNQKWNR